MDKLVWKAIPGWEGIYEASVTGLIRSVPRWIVQRNRWGRKMTCWRQSVVLRQSPNSHGYLSVPLRNGELRKIRSVHHLIALTFIGPRPHKLYVCHNNGDKTDNRVGNLRYATAAENVLDSIEHGTKPRGSRHYRYRVDIDHTTVLRLRSEGWTYRRLERELGLSTGMIGRILAGNRLRDKKKAARLGREERSSAR